MSRTGQRSTERHSNCSCGYEAGRILNAQEGASLGSLRRRDPSQTTMLRKAFMKNLDQRFRWLKEQIRIAVIERDVFGLRGPSTLRFNAPDYQAFNFPTDSMKLTAFMDWLEEMEYEGVLQVDQSTGEVLIDTSWKQHLRQAYAKGVLRGYSEMRKKKLLPEGMKGPEVAALGLYLAAPIHVRALESIFTRAYYELKGITEAMNQQISRTLAQGLAEGKGMEEIAAMVVNRVDAIGVSRARTLARTEVIRAHHSAMIQTFKEARIENVYIMVEWTTAGWGVCPDCAFLEGRLFTLEEVEFLIPLHPNCRCVAIPADVGESTRGEFDPSVIDPSYLDENGDWKRRGFYEQKTGRTSLPSRDIKAAKTFFGNWALFFNHRNGS